jgi:hypothetical protein
VDRELRRADVAGYPRADVGGLPGANHLPGPLAGATAVAAAQPLLIVASTDAARNLFFLISDVLIVVTALALALESAEEGARTRRWADALSAFTLNGAPAGYDSGWSAAVGVLGALGGLALSAAGLGIVIGIISDRIKEAQDAVAEEGVPRSYTGPSRPAPPWEAGAPRRLLSRAWRGLKRTQSS